MPVTDTEPAHHSDRADGFVRSPEPARTQTALPTSAAPIGEAVAKARAAAPPLVRRDPTARVRRSLAVWDPAVTADSTYGDAVVGSEHNADEMAARIRALPGIGGISHAGLASLSDGQLRALAAGLSTGFADMGLSYLSDPTGQNSAWVVKLWGATTSYEWKDQAITAFLDGITDDAVLELTGADQEVDDAPAPAVRWIEIGTKIFGRIDATAPAVKALDAKTLALFEASLDKGIIAEKGSGQDGVKWQHDPPQIKVRRTKLEALGEASDLRMSGTKTQREDKSWQIVFDDVTHGH